MRYQQINLLILASALLASAALSWMQLDKLTGNLLVVAFALLALLLVMQQIRWETRELPQQPMPVESQPEAPAPVMIILGPYAEKWFTASNYTDSTRYSGKAAWLLVKSPQELTQRLDYFQQHNPATPLAAFFPFLPDAHETSALLNDQLRHWLQDYSGIVVARKIPCTLGIYAQLSTEPRQNSAVNASWSDVLDLNLQQATTLPAAIQALQRAMVEQPVSVSNLQRAALGIDLLIWLGEQEVSETLKHIFAHSPLQLCSLLICDYGQGFTRHGAWAKWLEQRYAILPALGRRMTMPPLPSLKFPLHTKTPRIIPAPVYARQPALLWSLACVVLATALQIAAASWHSATQQHLIQQTINPLADHDSLSVMTLQQRLMQLQQLRAEWQSCSARQSLLNWGFSPCRKINQQLSQQIAMLTGVKVITTTMPLFEPGKAVMSAKATPILDEMAEQIQLAPLDLIQIIGHSDSTGADSINASLSLKRAQAVRDWLVKKKIATSRIQVRGVGATEPLTSNVTAKGRQTNRRVELLLIPTDFTKE